MQAVPQIRVFLASPGDVNEERAVALEVLDMLEYDPLFKRNGTGGVSIHAVAWDKPGGRYTYASDSNAANSHQRRIATSVGVRHCAGILLGTDRNSATSSRVS